MKGADRNFSDLLEAAPDAMIAVDKHGGVVLVNGQTEKLFGYERRELIGKTVELLMPAQFRDLHKNYRAQYASDPRVRPMGKGLTLYGLRKDGTEFPVEISLSPMRTDDGLVVIAAVRDVTERIDFQRELQEKNAELERASKAKDLFLAGMSHELRTPLNAIIGFTGTLLMELAGPINEEQQNQLAVVRDSARHLLSLINDLLDLARVDSGRVVLDFEPVCCQTIFDEVVKTQRSFADAKGIALEVVAPEEDVVVATDRRALFQIVTNLASNAIKFTDKGAVRLEVSRVNGNVEIAVADTGTGIKHEDRSRLFKAFEKLHSTKPYYEGTGLGLHVSQKLAALLGSEIVCESTFGRGSRFSLKLR